MGKKRVLVAGATGFIGKRLVASLVRKGHRVRCLVRKPGASLPEGTEQVVGDLLQPTTVPAAVRGIDTAFYLVHSMTANAPGFERRDREAAANFSREASAAGIGRVIYLGGLGGSREDLSHHLASRMEVAQVLRAGSFRTTFLRAAVIIGAGGASFEMIRALAERLPVVAAPRWVETRCQPIAVENVIDYLIGCLEDDRTAGETYDIGGPEILTYRQMIERLAAMENRHVRVVPLPFLSPRVSSYLAALIAPVPVSISLALIEGLRNEVICREERIREIIPVPLTPYDTAIRTALAEERHNH